METVEKYAVLVQSRFFIFFKILKTLKNRNRFWVTECNLWFLQKFFNCFNHRVFVFEFQARAAEQKVKPELLVVSVVRMAAHGREFNAVVISRKLVSLAAHLEVEFVIGHLRAGDYFAMKRFGH